MPVPPDESSALEDARLLARVAAGDRVAFRSFYDRHARALFALAVRMTGDRGAAEELLQDVFLKIWRHAAQFDPAKARPFTWAVTIARRTGIDHLRRQRRRLPAAALAAFDPSPDIPAPDAVPESAEAREDAVRLAAALGSLPAAQRAALELALFSALTHAEIAARLREPVGTVKTWIRRGLLALRASLNQVAP